MFLMFGYCCVQVAIQLTIQLTVQVTVQVTIQLTVQVTIQLTVQVTVQVTGHCTHQLCLSPKLVNGRREGPKQHNGDACGTHVCLPAFMVRCCVPALQWRFSLPEEELTVHQYLLSCSTSVVVQEIPVPVCDSRSCEDTNVAIIAGTFQLRSINSLLKMSTHTHKSPEGDHATCQEDTCC